MNAEYKWMFNFLAVIISCLKLVCVPDDNADKGFGTILTRN